MVVLGRMAIHCIAIDPVFGFVPAVLLVAKPPDRFVMQCILARKHTLRRRRGEFPSTVAPPVFDYEQTEYT